MTDATLPAQLGTKELARSDVAEEARYHLPQRLHEFLHVFSRWNPQDAGANQNIDQAGGGTTDNDGRFMYDDGPWQAGKEGVIPFLTSEAARQQPFFLIVSLVNPHDVLFYPKTLEEAGYDESWLVGDIRPPRSADEDLSTKPTVQQQFRNLTQVAASRFLAKAAPGLARRR